MRIVFGLVAAILVCAGWMICPVSVRAEVTRTVTPDAEIVEEMRAGADIIAAALAIRAPDLSDADGESRRQGH
ncbi:hypothetical protein X907_0155 [Glycocaulis alkaliphilus]|uniref:Uncharacterized protein n=1 Tax=Glycocaulis alkaliphilus TaxID=1434191 RepID=A0A3T0E5Q7_9PROT|nr:hypothetical protein [Glycocaulis alkaliphilus]AZU02705.1 hypothetical protein X907_0155 [Glycocaulis alkaliphilus]GGB79614.1 hypothetical protein GCM10007417_19410 [Glycocaulis alkaliphilus]